MSDSARALVDRGDLIELVARYSQALNSGRFDELEGLFAANARFLTPGREAAMPEPVVGPAAIRAAVESRYATVGTGAQMRHVIAATTIDELADHTARARSVLLLVATPRGGLPALRASGVYRDSFVRADGRWWFEERVLTLDGQLS